MRHKYITVCALIVFIVIIIIVFLLVFKNNSIIKAGILNYDINGSSYTYDFRLKESKKINIDNYENINNYIPINGGYFAVGQVEIEEDKYKNDIIYHYHNNTTVLYSYDSYSLGGYDLYLNGKYIFFMDNHENLLSINIENNELSIICYPIYNFTFTNHYLCYSEYNEKSDIQRKIYIFDCSKNDSMPVFIDSGDLKTNVSNMLIYEKNNKLYKYDITEKALTIIDESYLQKETKSLSFLGSASTNKGTLDFYSKWLYFSDVSIRKQSDEDKVLYFIPVFQSIIIDTPKGKQSIRVNKDSLVKIKAISIDETNYYVAFGESYYGAGD